jgi:hypothetical protein
MNPRLHVGRNANASTRTAPFLEVSGGHEPCDPTM